MNNAIDKTKQHEFKGTNIKTPFEKMRARAIISAALDAQGLSLINFNLTAFLPRTKRDDAVLILCLWACEPIRQNPDKFRKHRTEGGIALNKRAEMLITNLKNRSDLPGGFLETAHVKMKEAISQEMAHILQSVA